MKGDIKKILVKDGGNYQVKTVTRTVGELRQYRINNIIEQERLDGIALQMNSLFDAEFRFEIYENQHDGILDFVHVYFRNQSVVMYNTKYLESGCKNIRSFYKKFFFQDPYSDDFLAFKKAVGNYLQRMNGNTIYSLTLNKY